MHIYFKKNINIIRKAGMQSTTAGYNYTDQADPCEEQLQARWTARSPLLWYQYKSWLRAVRIEKNFSRCVRYLHGELDGD